MIINCLLEQIKSRKRDLYTELFLYLCMFLINDIFYVQWWLLEFSTHIITLRKYDKQSKMKKYYKNISPF